MPAHRFKSSNWSILYMLLTRVAEVLQIASKMYPVKGKTWWAGIGTLIRSRPFPLASVHSWYAKKDNLCRNCDSLDPVSWNSTTLKKCSSTRFFIRNQVARSWGSDVAQKGRDSLATLKAAIRKDKQLRPNLRKLLHL